MKMDDTKLIIVCGMSGVGKSTTSQNISYQYTMNGIANEWYHEEMKDHPIRWENGGEFQFEDMNLNISDTYARWETLISNICGVYVMEGCLYTNILRYFFPVKYPTDKIIEYYDKLMKILESANPHIIHLYRPDVEKNYRKAFKVRGKNWKNIITDGNNNYDFAIEREYQNLARKVFADYQGNKLNINTSDENWAIYYKIICEFLGIEYYDKSYIPISNTEIYAGDFEGLKIICEDNELYCSLSWWKYIKMNAIGTNEFELSGFPMVFKYSFLNNSVSLTVSGNYDWEIVGKTLYKKG